jgi:hypothetical protein
MHCKFILTAADIEQWKSVRNAEYIKAYAGWQKLSKQIKCQSSIDVLETVNLNVPKWTKAIEDDKKQVFNVSATVSAELSVLFKNHAVRNKGVKEFLALKYYLQDRYRQQTIANDSYIVKCTGRYNPIDITNIAIFLDRMTSEGYDSLSQLRHDGTTFTGFIAMKAAIFSEMIRTMTTEKNLIFLESNMVSVELAVSKWMHAKEVKNLQCDKFGIESNIANDCQTGVVTSPYII